MRGKCPRWILIASAVVLATVSSLQGQAESPVQVIHIHAKRYEFVPSEITLKAHQAVKLVFVSDDVPHGIFVDGLGIDVDMRKGHPVSTVITPASEGTYQGECSRYCGKGHDKMTFTVHVTR